MLRRFASLLLTVSALSSPAQANDSEEDAGTIIVTGSREAYRAVSTSSGTKTSAPILDIPQSISVVTAQQISDQNIRSMVDLMHLIPGATADQGEGHRDQIILRGNSSTADFFIDGLRDDAQYYRSFYNIDRVEALKGPNAMIFGRGGGGGVVNRVTKAARADKSLIEGTASGDSFGAWSLATDINAPVGSGVAVRLNAFTEHLNTHRDAFSGERIGINPVVGAELGKWTLSLGYEYVKDDRVIDRGIPSAFTGVLGAPSGPATGLRDRFFGVRGVNVGTVEAHIVSFRSRMQISDSLTLTTQALWANYDKIYTNAFAVTAISAAGTVGIESYRVPGTRRNGIGQANLEWKIRIGGMDHLILIGGEATEQHSTTERISGFFSPTVLTAANRRATVKVANPLTIPPLFFVAGPAGATNRKVSSVVGQVSAYVQDQIKLGGGFELIGGLRYDRLKIAVTNTFTGDVSRRVDPLWSPRAGLVFKPVPQASLYLSTSKSYLPQSGDQFLTFDASFTALEPETFDNLEAGAKWDIKPGLTATLAVYRLDRGNTRAVGPIPGTTVLTGGQRSTGAEFSLTGRITPHWQAALGYSYTKAKISQTTTAAPAGRPIALVPRHQVSLWNRFDLSRAIGVGLGVYHQGKSFTTISNVTELPAYTRVDAALFASIAKGIEAQVNFENIGNVRYFPTAHTDNNITPGAPFNVRFALSFKM
jgi:catecholate siderophore receptor